MSEDVYHRYIAAGKEAYIQDKVRAGHWFADEARQQADLSYERLLPDGLATPNHYFCAILDKESGQQVGGLWFYIEEGPHRSIWLYDLLIDAPHRRKGYGRQALQLLEVKAASLGVEAIRLHVFAHNAAAIALYEEVGYRVTSLNMDKRLLNATRS
jgi:RimJ/RimL family protein N-acetyltransferase